MNQSNNKTKHIAKRQVDNLMQASVHAKHYGMPLNIAATIYWVLAGGTGTWRKKQSRLYTNTRHWLYRRGAPWTAIWVVEAGLLGKEVHTHLAIHLPPHIPLGELDDYWRGQLKADEDRVLLMKEITSARGGLHGWLRYILKGMDPAYHKTFSIPGRHRQSQGIVLGKRCGTTQNIGPRARERRISEGRAAA